MLHGGVGLDAKSTAVDRSQPGAGGNHRSGPGAPVDRDQYWLDIWAFGTSPHGLGLSDDKLWRLTPREHAALVHQWERSRELPMQIHAGIQATLHNIHRDPQKHPKPFTPDMWMPGYEAKPQSLDEKMALLAGMMRREVKCPDCGLPVKAREVHNCYGK
jgi:hypothetical protein